MSLFDNIIEDVADRFGLGAKAGPLLRELLLVITGSSGGIGGFIDRLTSAGLTQATGWLGNPDGAPLTGSQVEQALGGDTVDMIAQRVGLSRTVASEALGYLAPKVIGRLTPGGIISAGTPSAVTDFLRSTAQTGARPAASALPDPAAISRASAGRWIVPLIALLVLAGLGAHFLANRTPSPVATTPGPTTVEQSRLSISNDRGIITVSGTVRDEATRNSIMDMLRSTFGSHAVQGNITVNPNAAPMPWLASLRGALDQLKTPGAQADFYGSSINVGGNLSDADRERMLSSLRTVFGPAGMTVALDRMANLVTEANAKAESDLAALGAGFRTADLLGILNKSIINFPTGSADVPAAGRSFLQQAAARLEQLPSDTVIEIAGYTDNTGDPAANLQLSQQRAEAVRDVLVESGVNPGMLVAKGYGSANPIASNDTPEGRFQNRRIEYHVIKQ